MTSLLDTDSIYGLNEELKVKRTPKDDSPAYIQSLPARINLREDILVEPAMLHKYGIITTLPFSKYASTNETKWETATPG